MRKPEVFRAPFEALPNLYPRLSDIISFVVLLDARKASLTGIPLASPQASRVENVHPVP